MIEDQFKALTSYCTDDKAGKPIVQPLPNGSHLITVPGVVLGKGWNRDKADVHFLAPPGYPAAKPDCFWVEPNGFRLENGMTPQNSNDSNPIPSDATPNRLTTWFSWHLQSWNPNRDSLLTFFNVIQQRLKPAR